MDITNTLGCLKKRLSNICRNYCIGAMAISVSLYSLDLMAASEMDSIVDVTVSPQILRLMDYHIGPSDTLTITVREHEDLVRTVTVRPDGKISFPLIGEISVVGMTPSQLQGVIAVNLQKYINILNSEVLISVDEVHSYKVSVLGEVRTPGRFEFQSKITVLDALAQAGGLTEFASRNQILILRPGENGMDRFRFDYRKVFESSADDEQIFLYPGDIVLVP